MAQKLIASASDLERIAADDHADVPALNGWRREVFGEEALALKHGKLALTAKGRSIKIICARVERRSVAALIRHRQAAQAGSMGMRRT